MSVLVATGASGSPVPSWCEAQDANTLAGVSPLADRRGAFSLAGFFDEQLQIDAEKAITQCIPLRASALLSNAKLQLDLIKCSNLLFCWELVPSYYGSSVFLDEATGRLVENPPNANDATEKMYKKYMGMYGSFFSRHPELEAFVYLCPTSDIVPGAPSQLLTSSGLTYSGITKMLNDGCSDGFTVIDGEIEYEDFLRGWYKTDHHWNMYGAYNAYLEILRFMEPSALPLQPVKVYEFDEPASYGSFTRRSLYLGAVDSTVDFVFDLPNFEVKIDGKTSSPGDLNHAEMYSNGEWSKSRFAARYGEYYHYDKALIELCNPDEEAGAKNLLVVADSYSNCIDMLLASHYGHTYIIDPRHIDCSIDEFLSSHTDVDQILILMSRQYMFDSATTEKFL